MNYIKNIGEKSLKAFENLKNVEHSKIKRALKEDQTLQMEDKLFLSKFLQIKFVTNDQK